MKFLSLFLVPFIVVGSSLNVGGAEPLGLANWLGRSCNVEWRGDERRINEIVGELEQLPALDGSRAGGRYGFQSSTMSSQDEPNWVQIDLGRSCVIDGLVVMPVNLFTADLERNGYGFPLRFRIEVSEDDDMCFSTVAVDKTMADVPHLGFHPFIFHLQPCQARYVRITSTKHSASKDGYIWALEELMVLSGNRNVAVGGLVRVSGQMELLPGWSAEWINDGQSALGIPASSEPSLTNGYLSASSATADAEKWLVVDLEREFPLEEIRLIPAEPRNMGVEEPPGYPRVGGRAFPRNLVVEASTDASFASPGWRREISSDSLGYPWGRPVTLPAHDHSARYVRVRAKQLWARGKTMHNFALAEMQVYAQNRNVALGKPVYAKDVAGRRKLTRWAPEFVVDGFSSRHRLLEIPHHLRLLEQRIALEAEQALLVARCDSKIETVATSVRLTLITLAGGVLLAGPWALLRQKVLRRRDTVLLREQIARDLHDDIGSNLGGIVLLSEMGSRLGGISAEARGDFEAIKKAAEETAESMQDIVWLIQPGPMGLRELIVKMRKSVEMILGDLSVSVTVEPADFRNRTLSLFFRRHVFFAFKETLNNVRRHASASKVEVKIELSATHLVFFVRDDGLGFNPRIIQNAGHGLVNIQRRAGRLRGGCRIESAPSKGTCLFFEAPLSV